MLVKLRNIYDLADTVLDMNDEGIIDALYEIKDKVNSLIEEWYDMNEFADEGMSNGYLSSNSN